MDHAVHEKGPALIVGLIGEIDLQNSPQVRKLLLDAIDTCDADADKKAIMVDLSQVAYLDSSGVASLIEAYQTARRRDVVFALVEASTAALRIIQLARLDKIFPVFATLEAGLADVG